MEKFDEQIQHINLLEIIDELKLKRKGKSFQCPNYQVHNNYDLNLSAYAYKKPDGLWVWKCYTCGAGGNAAMLIMPVYNISYKEAVRWLLKSSIIPIEDKTIYNVKAKARIPNEEQIEVLTNICNTLKIKRALLRFLKWRNITISTAEKYRIGEVTAQTLKYCQSLSKQMLYDIRLLGKPTDAFYKIRISTGNFIFPVFNEKDKVTSFQIRFPNTNKFLTIFSQQYCFGHHLLQENKRVMLFTEGATDALSAYDLDYLGLGIFGCTTKPLETINKLKNEIVFVCFDNDNAGKKNAEKLIRLSPNWYIKNIPSKFNDLNDYLIHIKKNSII